MLHASRSIDSTLSPQVIKPREQKLLFCITFIDTTRCQRKVIEKEIILIQKLQGRGFFTCVLQRAEPYFMVYSDEFWLITRKMDQSYAFLSLDKSQMTGLSWECIPKALVKKTAIYHNDLNSRNFSFFDSGLSNWENKLLTVCFMHLKS